MKCPNCESFMFLVEAGSWFYWRCPSCFYEESRENKPMGQRKTERIGKMVNGMFVKEKP